MVLTLFSGHRGLLAGAPPYVPAWCWQPPRGAHGSSSGWRSHLQDGIVSRLPARCCCLSCRPGLAIPRPRVPTWSRPYLLYIGRENALGPGCRNVAFLHVASRPRALGTLPTSSHCDRNRGGCRLPYALSHLSEGRRRRVPVSLLSWHFSKAHLLLESTLAAVIPVGSADEDLHMVPVCRLRSIFQDSVQIFFIPSWNKYV